MKRFKTIFLLSFCIILSHACAQQPGDSIYSYKNPSPDGKGKYYKGREIAQVMSFEGADWLERNTRQKEENTSLAISKLPINKYKRCCRHWCRYRLLYFPHRGESTAG